MEDRPSDIFSERVNLTGERRRDSELVTSWRCTSTVSTCPTVAFLISLEGNLSSAACDADLGCHISELETGLHVLTRLSRGFLLSSWLSCRQHSNLAYIVGQQGSDHSALLQDTLAIERLAIF